ncbi:MULTISPECIES: transglutaminase TgpA family protein [Sporosarcina]|uniref:transglutaminase TgpA family protein n=1 Tax=Sporosarcina TaxID=1569 RepID=UPI00129BC2BC|nr:MULTISPECIES: transglutaminase domain-containing protein [Sporosarcina]GKV65355.1 protease [Sporosarcina sp. NCCP-2331]GLB55479.1 protease [Sporosarcina sp. NCCP-2378]
MKKSRLNWKVLLFLYVLSVILLWEWFIPIMELTDFGYPSLFLIYLILFFVLALFDVTWWLSAIIQLLYVVWTIHYIYFGQFMFSSEIIGLILTDIKQNFSHLFQGDVGELSNLFRTLLLYTLIWMVSYLIRHWIEVRNSMMMFFAVTVVFIALLDTFSPYDASASIVRIMMVGLLIVGYLTLIKLAPAGRASLRPKRLLLLSLPMLLLIATVGLVSRQLPVYPPAWPDPVPFLLSMGGESGQEGNVSKAGYDPDDSQLGGAFIQDHQLVFEADVQQRQYWRIETKDTYTTKGWIQTNEADSEILQTNEDFLGNEDTELSYANLHFEQQLPFLVTPYGARAILHPESLSIMRETEANRMYLLMGAQEELRQYEVGYETPKYKMSELEKAEMLAYETLPVNLDSYLLLPPELPNRVKELALSITEEETSVYGKVKAMEQYFKRNGFVYETQNVAVPGPDEDYVDQFLFDTKKGYCDNFSTSMAVMLRSAGIPTRWVKGFAPGDPAFKSSGKSVYRVTNDEAHSWVEAYIPEVGWMPFEPTIGFSHPTDIKFDTSKDEKDEQMIKQPEKPKVEKEEQKKKSASSSPLSSKVIDAVKWFFSQWWLYVSLALLLAGGTVLGYTKRTSWLPKWRVKQLSKCPDGWEKFEQQYKELLQQLKRIGFSKEPGMTLSTYAAAVDTRFGGKRMHMLTAAYEKGIYGQDRETHDWNKLNEVWEDLIINATC